MFEIRRRYYDKKAKSRYVCPRCGESISVWTEKDPNNMWTIIPIEFDESKKMSHCCTCFYTDYTYNFIEKPEQSKAYTKKLEDMNEQELTEYIEYLRKEVKA